MAKVIVQKLEKAGRNGSRSSLEERRVYNPAGQLEKVLTINSNSASFSSDLLQVFKKNVAKARRENKKQFGSPDRVGKKT